MKNMTILPDSNIKQAMKKLSKSGEKCLIVVDETNLILGTLSNGDLRKAILAGSGISDSIIGIYQSKPVVLVKGQYNLEEAKRLLLNNKFDLIPVLDRQGKVVDALVWDEIFTDTHKKVYKKLNVPVIIMAGGKGTRLEPFTKVLPKPLVPIHEKPVIEHIMDRFTDVGINRFIVTINYKARIMRAFFEELNPDFSVDVVEEKEPLGTAGCLNLLKSKFDEPIIVTNSDVIIKIDYKDLYEFHKDNKYDLTLVASMKNFSIPYGTCELNGEGNLNDINEKPEFDFLVNTGLYVLNPDLINLIPRNTLYHMTQLIKDSKKNGKRVGVYPIDDECWIDVGQWAEYQKAVELL